MWTLPFALAIWANLHGGFVAGIGIVGLAAGLRTAQSYAHRGWRPIALWRDTRAMWGLLLACLAASLLTPHGWRTWPFLLTELGNPYNRRFITEWQPVKLAAMGWSGALALLMMAGVALAALAAQRRNRTVWDVPPWLWGVSVLPLAAMALSSNRHIPIFVLWAAPVLALLADAAYRMAERRRLCDRALLFATALAGLAAAFTITFAVVDPAPRDSHH